MKTPQQCCRHSTHNSASGSLYPKRPNLDRAKVVVHKRTNTKIVDEVQNAQLIRISGVICSDLAVYTWITREGYQKRLLLISNRLAFSVQHMLGIIATRCFRINPLERTVLANSSTTSLELDRTSSLSSQVTEEPTYIEKLDEGLEVA